jgi:hypothetical protein
MLSCARQHRGRTAHADQRYYRPTPHDRCGKGGDTFWFAVSRASPQLRREGDAARDRMAALWVRGRRRCAPTLSDQNTRPIAVFTPGSALTLPSSSASTASSTKGVGCQKASGPFWFAVSRASPQLRREGDAARDRMAHADQRYYRPTPHDRCGKGGDTSCDNRHFRSGRFRKKGSGAKRHPAPFGLRSVERRLSSAEKGTRRGTSASWEDCPCRSKILPAHPA